MIFINLLLTTLEDLLFSLVAIVPFGRCQTWPFKLQTLTEVQHLECQSHNLDRVLKLLCLKIIAGLVFDLPTGQNLEACLAC